MTKTRAFRRGAVAVVALFFLIQLVPYGHSSTNPPVGQAVKWDSPATAKIFAAHCQDCHSNLTTYRWYDHIAPASWLVQHDIDDGRARLNVSEWNRPQPPLSEVVDAIKGGGMPPLQYKVMYGGLSQKEKDQLAAGFARIYKHQPPTIQSGGG